MVILAVGDEVSPTLEKALLSRSFPKVGIILSCGDLPYDYLEFLVDAAQAPLLYVHGNHDRPVETEDRVIRAPQGCLGVDGRVVEVGTLIVLGLGGSRRYSPKGEHQYTEGEMRRRARRLYPKLRWNSFRKGRAMDILLTHAPPRGVHDAEDPAHQGFDTFLRLIHRWKPKLHVHGHTPPRPSLPTETMVGATRVVHVRGFRLLEI
ncbi:MAG: metallophosphoesterase [Candidatus Bipolaricaulota bacterium]|nr:metallophosphoesterase [Candidatus Bipolaricaulota bacterium]MDW8127136.1 metallophosphoesterase [Candidatus Bipolaricaulota bacterium]